MGFAQARKAVFAGITALLTGEIVAFSDNATTLLEQLVAIAGTVAAVAAVYNISNDPQGDA